MRLWKDVPREEWAHFPDGQPYSACLHHDPERDCLAAVKADKSGWVPCRRLVRRPRTLCHHHDPNWTKRPAVSLEELNAALFAETLRAALHGDPELKGWLDGVVAEVVANLGPDVMALRGQLREARILLAWSKGALIAYQAEELLGVGRGELWALERRHIEAVKGEANAS